MRLQDRRLVKPPSEPRGSRGSREPAPASRLDDEDQDRPDPFDGVPADTRDAFGRVWP